MSCIDILYTGTEGLYCSVKPISDVPVPEILAPAELEWDPVHAADFHATIAYNSTCAIPREAVEAWLESQGITEQHIFRAASIGTPQWWENDGKVYVGVEMYSPELFGLNESLKALGATSSYPSYKCHLTYGCWRGIPPGLVLDRLFMNEFVKTMVRVQVPNIIEFSLLNISNAKQ